MAITEWIRSSTGANHLLVGRTGRNNQPAYQDVSEVRERKDTPLRRIANMRTGAWFVSLADAYLEKPKPPYQRKYGWVSPGDLAHKCDFFLALRYLAVLEKSKPIPARRQRIFDVGNARDIAWKGLASATGVSLIKGGSESYRRSQRWIQLPIFHIRGEFDDLIQNPETGEIYILEIKTMNTDEWKELKSPKDDHIHQAQPYIFAVQERLGVRLAGVMYLYENKNTQEVKTYVVPFNAKVWEEDSKRVQRIADSVEAGEMPMRTPVKNETECPFHYLCAGFDVSKYERPPA